MSIFRKEYIQKQARAMEDELISIRRTLHAHPELGTHEHKTDQLIIGYLSQWGIDVQFPVADTGIVAIVRGKAKEAGENSGAALPVVALRADIDALPLQEDKERPYCSKNDGVMHACGHDAHTAIALGVARFLKMHEQEWAGTVKFFFQPAEETCGGAERMVNAGCMENPAVDYVIGLHMMPTLEYGEVELRYNDLNASSDEVDIIVHGVSTHCSHPEDGVDAIVMAAAVVQNLQTVISRSLSPLKNAVLSLGTVEGGTAHNIIADQVTLKGTLRTTEPQTRQALQERIRCIVEDTCRAYGGRGELIIRPGYDALVNDNAIVDVIKDAAARRLNLSHIHFKEAPSLGVEDFSFFLNKAQGAFYHLGCACKEKGITAPLHSPDFDIDERALGLGVELQTAIVGRLLAMPKKETAAACKSSTPAEAGTCPKRNPLENVGA